MRRKAARRAWGEIFRNPAQANSLELIAKTNGDAFYRGELAQKLPPSPKHMVHT